MFINIPDVIILTETWLNYKIDDQELGLNNYYVYRRDRKLKNDKIVKGGGVLIAIAKSLKSSAISNIQTSNTVIDELYVKVKLKNNIKYVFGVVYIPPYAVVKDYQIHIENAEKISYQFKDHKFIYCGDYLQKLSGTTRKH